MIGIRKIELHEISCVCLKSYNLYFDIESQINIFILYFYLFILIFYTKCHSLSLIQLIVKVVMYNKISN